MAKQLKNILANNLRQQRLAKGLSQEELANLCELHRTYIGGVERAERNITLSTLEKISAALDVSPLTLLNGTKWSVQNLIRMILLPLKRVNAFFR
jgi:transcriptional regulator with XRE-family HTH domain